MTSIVINDLPLDKQLDQKALSAVTGGKTVKLEGPIGSIKFGHRDRRKNQVRRRLQPKLGYAMTL